MKFKQLQTSIQNLDEAFQIEAGKAVNRLLTMRNWLIGFYIVEYEQRGEDRAVYGESLLQRLATTLNAPGLSYRNLRLFRQFYESYSRLQPAVFQYLGGHSIWQTVSAKLQIPENQTLEIGQTASAKLEPYQLPPEKLLNSLSFSHFTLIMPLPNPLQRAFYEIESIKGGWNVRELKRQISTLLFERTGLSEDKEELLRRVHQKAGKMRPEDFLRSPVMFEFLGLPLGKLIEETDLEKALLDHLQEFLLELGTGFCFEARQKRILIGDTWHKIDLVFYHRILRCHVLIDLKTEDFKLDHAGQMNGYVNFFKENSMLAADNPPVGLLLCSGKNEGTVRYALGGLDENIFVREYKLLLPDEETLKNFIEHEMAVLQIYQRQLSS